MSRFQLLTAESADRVSFGINPSYLIARFTKIQTEIRENFETRRVSMLRYEAPTRSRCAHTWVHGARDHEAMRCDVRRGAARRGEASRIPRVSRLSLDVNHASSGPTHAYVSLKRPVSRSSRRIPPVWAFVSITSRKRFGRNFVGRISHASSPTRRGPVFTTGVFRRCANAIRAKRCSVITHPRPRSDARS